jgi:hypothetical protein
MYKTHSDMVTKKPYFPIPIMQINKCRKNNQADYPGRLTHPVLS